MRFDHHRSLQLDWAILMVESTRGWRRLYWRLVKRWLERGIC
jgi:hypothetical protein